MDATGQPVLIVTAVDREAEAIGSVPGAMVVASGIGRTNAAVTTTETIMRHGPFRAVVCMGVAGALPGGGLELGDVVAASKCVYAEEGLITPEGFQDMTGLGFSLGDFPGNVVPVDEPLLGAIIADGIRVGAIATVATCSGTDEAAEEVVRRTGALAEAMEGAAVVHASRRFGLSAVELRVISNTTGQRDRQHWDLAGALAVLRDAARAAVPSIHADTGAG